MDNHVASLCRLCFFQLRQLRTIQSVLTKQTTVTFIQAFVSSRLDYCNSLLYGISSTLLRRLQSIQNAAARLVTGAKKFDHITPVLRELHCLHCDKLSLLVYKYLHNAAPVYLSSDCVPVSSLAGRRQLRSSVSGTLDSQRTRTILGCRAFRVCGPATWNTLPTNCVLPLCVLTLSAKKTENLRIRESSY